MLWDSLPYVAQEYVLEAINGVRRLQEEDGAIARRLWARADPQRVKAHEQQMERFQARLRGKTK